MVGHMVVGTQLSSIVVVASSPGCTLLEAGVLGYSSACCLFIIKIFFYTIKRVLIIIKVSKALFSIAQTYLFYYRNNMFKIW